MKRRQLTEHEAIEEGLKEHLEQQNEDARSFGFSRNQTRHGHHLTGYDRERFLARKKRFEADSAWDEYRAR